MKQLSIFAFLSLFLLANSLSAQTNQADQKENSAVFEVRLKNKIVPLSHPVYRILDYYEASGEINFLPQAKPYTKIDILKILNQLMAVDHLSEKEKTVINNHIIDMTRDSNGLQLYKQAG